MQQILEKGTIIESEVCLPAGLFSQLPMSMTVPHLTTSAGKGSRRREERQYGRQCGSLAVKSYSMRHEIAWVMELHLWRLGRMRVDDLKDVTGQ